jgi:hypothetical protein
VLYNSLPAQAALEEHKDRQARRADPAAIAASLRFGSCVVRAAGVKRGPA